MSGQEFSIEVQPRIPEPLQGLVVLADDLAYSFNRKIRSLFYRLDPQLWERCNHNPKVFLRRVAQQRLEEAVDDAYFMEDYKQALSWYEDYRAGRIDYGVDAPLAENELVAYFSAEFGFHESLPIYSGGLGILAGDHCKAASDLKLPFVGVGLLYHQGYFTQTIDGEGRQIAEYRSHDFKDLPIAPACDADGREIRIQMPLADRTITLRVWTVTVGNIAVYLLDSDVPENSENDRSITYRLYGGDRETRIQQEMVLGIGGVRALRALGLAPAVWHINEGHSAFQTLARLIEFIEQGLDFDAAVEAVASSTVFTTHTPVPAGHDLFDHALVLRYLDAYLAKLGVDKDTFLALGDSPGNPGRFNMTALAMRLSRHQNGVSRIHGRVASEMERYVWPQIPPEDNPITYITNGVHVDTFLAREWAGLFDSRLRNWRARLCDAEFWKTLANIEDYRFWGIRQALRAEMLRDVHQRVVARMRRNGCSESLIRKATRYIDEPDRDVLVLGFARRFATYKRATLMFADPERLKRLLTDPKRPVVVIFAGKAHPQDEPGQQLIKTIHDFSQHPDFIGHIILLENYDMALARKLVSGVDVWINNPEYPLEACGTSGQKAAINGVLNLSVLDGWWDEGYNGANGWAVVPHEPHYDPGYRYREEAADLINILENEVVPAFYERGTLGYSERWIRMCRESMWSILPRFNAQRMVLDYITKMYRPAIRGHEVLMRENARGARELAAWKRVVRDAWPNVSLRLIDEVPAAVSCDAPLSLEVEAALGGLGADDVRVELVLGERDEAGAFRVVSRHPFSPAGDAAGGRCRFGLSLPMLNCGLMHFKVCIYPYHPLLAHPYEMGRMKWL